MQGVVVLFDELARGVDDTAGEVKNEKALVVADLPVRFEIGLARHVQPEVIGVLGVHFGGEMVGTGRGQLALLVQQVEDANVLLFDQVWNSREHLYEAFRWKVFKRNFNLPMQS